MILLQAVQLPILINQPKRQSTKASKNPLKRMSVQLQRFPLHSTCRCQKHGMSMKAQQSYGPCYPSHVSLQSQDLFICLQYASVNNIFWFSVESELKAKLLQSNNWKLLPNALHWMDNELSILQDSPVFELWMQWYTAPSLAACQRLSVPRSCTMMLTLCLLIHSNILPEHCSN